MVSSREKKIARDGVSAEFDAINLYERMSAQTKDPKVKKVLQDITKEEKTHVGEFQSLLKRADTEQKKELVSGEKEASKLGRTKGGTKRRSTAKRTRYGVYGSKKYYENIGKKARAARKKKRR